MFSQLVAQAIGPARRVPSVERAWPRGRVSTASAALPPRLTRLATPARDNSSTQIDTTEVDPNLDREAVYNRLREPIAFVTAEAIPSTGATSASAADTLRFDPMSSECGASGGRVRSDTSRLFAKDADAMKMSRTYFRSILPDAPPLTPMAVPEAAATEPTDTADLVASPERYYFGDVDPADLVASPERHYIGDLDDPEGAPIEEEDETLQN